MAGEPVRQRRLGQGTAAVQIVRPTQSASLSLPA